MRSTNEQVKLSGKTGSYLHNFNIFSPTLVITLAILLYIYKFFDTPSSTKGSQIPLPWSVVWTYHF